MKTILLLRHGKSSWKDPDLTDHDRPLKMRGKKDAGELGHFMVLNGIIPDLIFCSTARRAKDTVKHLLETLSFEGEIIYTRDLYHGYPDDYIDILRGVCEDINCVMVVAHNPGLEEFLSNLTDIEEWLPTSALAQIDLDLNRWGELDDYSQGELVGLWRPIDLVA